MRRSAMRGGIRPEPAPGGLVVQQHQRRDAKRAGDVTPAGVSCRVCERLDCTQRAHPPVNHRLRVDQALRRAQPFDFVR